MVHILRMAEELKINRDQKDRQGAGWGRERAGWQWRWGKARKRRREEEEGRGDHTRRVEGVGQSLGSEWEREGERVLEGRRVYCTDMTFSFEMVMPQAGHLAEGHLCSLCP